MKSDWLDRLKFAIAFPYAHFLEINPIHFSKLPYEKNKNALKVKNLSLTQ